MAAWFIPACRGAGCSFSHWITAALMRPSTRPAAHRAGRANG